MAQRPRVRDDVALMAGYHSPQLDVDVRLNANESPFAPPQELSDRVADAVRRLAWNRYPDRGAVELRAAIAAHHGRTSPEVFAANGSNEVLYTLFHAYGGAGRVSATFEPTYALHTHLARISGTATLEAERDPDFRLDVDTAEQVVREHEPDLVFLCSPNNPSGVVDPPHATTRLLDAVESYGGLLIVDEAYGQFAPQSALDLVAEERSLVVTRTFSKTWSMAGLRLGYLIGPTWLVDELEKVALPYHLDAVTQIAGRLALDYADAMHERVAALVSERERLMARLDQMPVTVWPSGSNFVLFRPDERDGAEVWKELVERSVLVRDCSSWPRLEGCLRVTIGTVEEDDRFLDALAEVLN